MKGLVVEKPGVVALKRDIPEPAVSDYCVVTETIACGFCNSTDRKLIEGRLKGFDTYPAVLGHESVGRVVEVGKRVRAFRKGDIVLGTLLDARMGNYFSGWGAFSEYNLAHDHAQMVADGVPGVNEFWMAQQVIPKDLDPVKSVMIITFKEVLAGLTGFGIREGKSVVINGCGPVGLSMVRLAAALGAGRIFAVDVDADRLELAAELGAQIVINPSREDVASKIRDSQKGGVDFFVDAVGSAGLLNAGIDLVARGGKVCVYGISPGSSATIDWSRAPDRWTVQFSQSPDVAAEASVHERVLEYVRSGFLDLDLFVTHAFPLEDFQKGMDLVKRRQALKVSFTLRP